MSYATVAYIPPDSECTRAFIRNIIRFKPRYPLLTYSDQPDAVTDRTIKNPELARHKGNRVAVHNMVFLEGLKMADELGLKRFIYLEADCRVGCDYWDEVLFKEAEQYPSAFACGTPAVFNTTSMPDHLAKPVRDYIARFTEATGLTVPVYPCSLRVKRSAMFLMGALTVFNTAIACDVFAGYKRDPITLARKIPAFDLHFGCRVQRLFSAKAPDKLPFLTKSYSSYKNHGLDYDQRIEALKGGRFVAVHQVKTAEDCL